MILIKNNMKLVYKSRTTYLILVAVISFIIFFALSDINYFYSIFQNDIFLWIVVILANITIHRKLVYSISYSILARMTSKRNYIIYNFIMLLLSTIIICFLICSIPYIILLILNHKITGFEKIVFFFVRYSLVSFFAQYIIFLLMLIHPKIQKNNNVIYIMPVLLFFIITLPKEFLYSNFNMFVPSLDFGSGGSILITKENLMSIIFYKNIHLIGYIICLILLSVNFLVNYMEMLENGENSEP